MLAFRSPQDVEDARLSPELRRVARDALTTLVLSYAESGCPYDPDADGYVVLSDDTGDDPELARLLGRPFPEVLLEDVAHDRDAGCFVAVLLCNDQFGLTVLVPDTPALLARVREWLLSYVAAGEVAP